MTQTDPGATGLHEAAGLLRLALPLMSHHEVPVTPHNYAVWYRYVSGEDSDLRETIDRHIESGQPFSAAISDHFYRRFVLDIDADNLETMRSAVLSLLDGLASSVETADSEFLRYVGRLGDHGERLQGPLPQPDLLQLVRTLTEDTRAAHESGEQLCASLTGHRRDTGNLRQELLRLRNEASTDPLTGLANRRALTAALEEARHDHTAGSTFSLIFADIDHFKKINDRYGHLLGDKVLRYVASVMKRSVKGRDTVARYGGEEFMVVLPETPYVGAMSLARSLRSAIEAGRLVRSDTRERIGSVTLSFGVAVWREGEQLDDLLGRVDSCLYRAKQLGRNRVVGEQDSTETVEVQRSTG